MYYEFTMAPWSVEKDTLHEVVRASSGIGTETARVLALRGVHVVMGVRNMASGKEAKEAMVKEIPTAKIEAMELDLSSLASVRKFASEFNSLGLPLNLLMYSSLSAYGQSKLANVLHANQLARDLKDNGVEITANSLHPGAIATNLFRHYRLVSGNHIACTVLEAWLLPSFRMWSKFGGNHANVLGVILLGLVDVLGKYVIKNVQQGAATTCYVALHPQVKGMSGKYFADCKLAEASSQANDTELAKKLWDFSLRLINQCAHAS
ncbi:hypothetical protein C3L33_16417, partial [Rhododendron williamsianum]